MKFNCNYLIWRVLGWGSILVGGGGGAGKGNGENMPAYAWYAKLKKPAWAPPAWLFGPVWTCLYVVIAISFAKVFLLAWQGVVPAVTVVPFILNLIFNLSFTPIQFGLKNNYLAAVDILLVLGTLVWAMAVIFVAALKLSILGGPNIQWIGYSQIPYLLWVMFATVLQLTVTWLNR